MIYKIQQGKLEWGEKSEEETQNQARKRNQKESSTSQIVVLGVMCFLSSQHPLSSAGNRTHLSVQNVHFLTLTPYG